jgi:uncharacterized membrane protein YedE/YeeE
VLIMTQQLSNLPAGRGSSGSGPQPYWNPYLAGLLLGGALLASYLILGAGLGASAATARLGAVLESWVLPSHTVASEYFGRWFADGANPLAYYLVFLVVGTLFGGLISAVLAGRFEFRIERGQAYPASKRLLLAGIGGLIVGYASRLAGGCTSGQALSGGALLLDGSLVFLICLFASGYAVAWFFRRQWHD